MRSSSMIAVLSAVLVAAALVLGLVFMGPSAEAKDAPVTREQVTALFKSLATPEGQRRFATPAYFTLREQLPKLLANPMSHLTFQAKRIDRDGLVLGDIQSVPGSWIKVSYKKKTGEPDMDQLLAYKNGELYVDDPDAMRQLAERVPRVKKAYLLAVVVEEVAQLSFHLGDNLFAFDMRPEGMLLDGTPYLMKAPSGRAARAILIVPLLNTKPGENQITLKVTPQGKPYQFGYMLMEVDKDQKPNDEDFDAALRSTKDTLKKGEVLRTENVAVPMVERTEETHVTVKWNAPAT